MYTFFKYRIYIANILKQLRRKDFTVAVSNMSKKPSSA